VRRQRLFSEIDRQTDRDGGLLQQVVSIGTGLDARLNSFLQLRYYDDRILAGDRVLSRRGGYAYVQLSPSQLLNDVSLEARVGQEIDFENARRGNGASFTFTAALRPTDHVALRFDDSLRFLNVDDDRGRRTRLFTARIDRLRASYTFSARSFLRAIVQRVETKRDPLLYEDDEVDAVSRSLTASLLFAYKLNWQTVLFVGIGDDRALDEDQRLRPTGRSLFVKLSYAFQR
jgi:hypothetical protein